MKKLTIRMEDELHKKVKIKLIHEDKSFQRYVIDLIEKDIETDVKVLSKS